MWFVVVSFGNTDDLAVYARVPAQTSANKLAKAAKRRGYKDARVMSEEDFYEAQEARRAG